eukprot:5762451-Prymnesium_polylepis.2
MAPSAITRASSASPAAGSAPSAPHSCTTGPSCIASWTLAPNSPIAASASSCAACTSRARKTSS